MNRLKFASDVRTVKDLLGLSTTGLAEQIQVGSASVERWLARKSLPRRDSLESFYSFAYAQGIRLNGIKSQLRIEELAQQNRIPLFHGSKRGLDGAPTIGRCHGGNDFGKGFYCGESFEQSASFVAASDRGMAYVLGFDPTGLVSKTYTVNNEWMLAVAFFRGRLTAYGKHPTVQKIITEVQNCDYIVAPIADNRMYEVINAFIDGEETDVICEHSLAATNLGKQYVLLSERAFDKLEVLESCYLCKAERRDLLRRSTETSQQGLDKAKVARKTYRGQGVYIEELLS